METLTPTRAKRNSRVPERFCSDDAGIEITSASGETIFDYDEKTTSTTHRLAPITGKIRIKSIREPLKVKLPKLKRLQSTHDPVKEKSTKQTKSNNSEVKIHKIKLPSLSSRKYKSGNNDSDSSGHKVTKNKKNKSNTDEELKVVKEHKMNEGDESFTTNKVFEQKQTCSDHDIDSIVDSKLDSPSTSKTAKDCKSSDTITAADKIGHANRPDNQDLSSVQKDTSQQSFSTNSNGIKCPCGVDDDLGVMVECEKCSTWQHGHCINVGPEEDAYEGYVCAYCTLPPEKSHESLFQLTIGDELQSRFNQLNSDAGNQTSSDKGQLLFNVPELVQATQNLKRVMNSVRVKWRLLVSKDYEAELRIWRNPVWSPDNITHDKDRYFFDYCRDNLKLNVRNMLREMGKRCRLILDQISLAKITHGNDNSQTSNELETLSDSIRDIARIRQGFEDEMRNL